MVVVRTGIEIAFNFFFYMLYEDPVIDQNIINGLMWELVSAFICSSKNSENERKMRH